MFFTFNTYSIWLEGNINNYNLPKNKSFLFEEMNKVYETSE